MTTERALKLAAVTAPTHTLSKSRCRLSRVYPDAEALKATAELGACDVPNAYSGGEDDPLKVDACVVPEEVAEGCSSMRRS